jgi:hypothetical protein
MWAFPLALMMQIKEQNRKEHTASPFLLLGVGTNRMNCQREFTVIVKL